MHIPKPLPDELARGLLGRIRILNVLETIEDAIRRLHNFIGDDGPPRANRHDASLLPSAANMSPIAFVMKHTLVPFNFAFSNNREKGRHERRLDEYFSTSHHEAKLTEAFLCPNCVREDQLLLGFSYWRRTHHLPGIHWCLKHECSLLRVIGLNPYFDTPAFHADSALSYSPDYILAAQENSVIQRYVEICCNLLDREASFDSTIVADALCGKAEEFGLHVGKRGGAGRPLLSDVALTALPNSWLTTNFPWFAQKVPGQDVQSFNRLTSHLFSSMYAENYVLAAALMSTHQSVDLARKFGMEARQYRRSIGLKTVRQVSRRHEKNRIRGVEENHYSDIARDLFISLS